MPTSFICTGSARPRAAVAARLSPPPVHDACLGISRYRRRRLRAQARLMLGRILRISSLLTIALATVLTLWFIDLGLSPWIAIAIGLLLPFFIHAFPLGLEFITGALIDRRPIARLNLIDALRVWLIESWRSFVVFNIDQPWRANFPERPIVNDPARPAVLLVPGTCAIALPGGVGCAGKTTRLECRDHQSRTWCTPSSMTIRKLAPILEKLRADSGAEHVTLVLPQHGRIGCTRLSTRERSHCGGTRRHHLHPAPWHRFRALRARDNTRQMRRECANTSAGWPRPMAGRVHLLRKPARQPGRPRESQLAGRAQKRCGSKKSATWR